MIRKIRGFDRIHGNHVDFWFDSTWPTVRQLLYIHGLTITHIRIIRSTHDTCKKLCVSCSTARMQEFSQKKKQKQKNLSSIFQRSQDRLQKLCSRRIPQGNSIIHAKKIRRTSSIWMKHAEIFTKLPWSTPFFLTVDIQHTHTSPCQFFILKEIPDTSSCADKLRDKRWQRPFWWFCPRYKLCRHNLLLIGRGNNARPYFHLKRD